LSDRLEKRWKKSAELGKRLAQRTREARKTKHDYLASVYVMLVEAWRTDKLEALWRRAQPGTTPVPSTPKDLIAGVIRGTYADKELERDSVHQWAQAVCGAVVTECPPARASAFFAEGGIAKAREAYRAHTRKAPPSEAAAKGGGGSGRGPRKPEAHASSAGRKLKGRATSRSGPPPAANATKAPTADGRWIRIRLTGAAVQQAAEIQKKGRACPLGFEGGYEPEGGFHARSISPKLRLVSASEPSAATPRERPVPAAVPQERGIAARGKRPKARSAR
jgi:hypothetical protein